MEKKIVLGQEVEGKGQLIFFSVQKKMIIWRLDCPYADSSDYALSMRREKWREIFNK